MAISEEARLIVKIAAENATQQTFNQMDSSFNRLKDTAIKVGAAVIGAFAFKKLTDGFKEVIELAMEEEQGIARLGNAVRNAGGDWEQLQGGIEGTIQAMVRTTAFSDGEMRDALSLLVALTEDTDEAMRRLPIAMDLARGAGIDLATASKLLGKVSDENVTVLRRYGISVKDGADATELLAAVQTKFGGQAETFAKTTSGSWQILQNKINDLKEDLGAAFLPVAEKVFTRLIEFIEEIRNNPGIQNFAGAVERGIEVLGELFGLITGSSPGAGAALTDALGEERAQGITKALGDIHDIVKVLTDALRDMAGWLTGSSEEAEALRAVLGFVGEKMLWLAGTAIGSTIGQMKTLVEWVKTAVGWITELANKIRNMPVFGGGGGAPAGSGGGGGAFAEGGIVTRPTMGLIGEAGPEAVIPLSRAGGMIGGTTIVLNVHDNITRSEEELAGRISDVLVRQLMAQRAMSY